MVHRLALTAAALLVPAIAWGAPHGTVVMRDGRRFDDVEYEVQGTRVRVKTRYGAASFDLGDVQRLIPKAAPSAGPAEAEVEELEEERGIDWETRFRLEPPDGWEVADPSGPLVRAALRHQRQDALLEVTVRPAVGPWDLSDPRGRVPRELSDAINAELATFYERCGGGRFSVTGYQGDRVVRIENLKATEYGAARGVTRAITELRFQRFGFEYAVTLSLGEEVSLPEEERRAALGAFSFLPTVAGKGRRYSDMVRGFSLRAPAGWRTIDRPFDDRRPLLLRTEDGRAEVSVAVVPSRSARQVVEDAIAERRKASRYLEAERIEQADQGGSRVVRFRYEDFRAGGRKKLRYQGFAASLHEQVLLITGIAPLSDEDARKLQGEVEAVLASVRLQDAAFIAATMTRQKDALGYVSAGADAMGDRRNEEAIQKFDRAIELYGTYALAYYLRAQAKKNLRQFDAFREDLTRAGELAPGRGYDAELLASVAEEAAVEHKRHHYRRAIELWTRAYRSSKESRHLDALCDSLRDYAKEAEDEEQYDRCRDIEDLAQSVETVPEVAETLVKIYGRAAHDLGRAEEFREAKRVLRLLRGVARATRSDELEEVYDEAWDRLKAAEEKARRR